MTHALEHAASGRSKCRGCGGKIEQDELRFGERQPNPFGEGDTTLWFHPACAAHKRPEPYLELLGELDDEVPDGLSLDDLTAAQALRATAEFGAAHRRVPRIDGASRAPTARARCRSCGEMIAKDDWRIGLVYFEDYRFQPSGFIHVGCATDYFETDELMDRIRFFSPSLGAAELDEVSAALTAEDGR